MEGQFGRFFRPETGLRLAGMAIDPALKRWAIFIKSISMAEAFNNAIAVLDDSH
jgi:hypothetical protein